MIYTSIDETKLDESFPDDPIARATSILLLEKIAIKMMAENCVCKRRAYS